MKRESFLRELRGEARRRGLEFRILESRGKGSHYRVHVGQRFTTVQSGELTPIMMRSIRKQLGLEDIMHDYRYLVVLTDDPDGAVNATFPDVPEAITYGEDRPNALRSASEALGLALRGYLANGKGLPEAIAAGDDMVSPYLDDVLKIAFVDSFRQSNVSREEFARLSGLKQWKVEALLDPDADNGISELENALTILGRRLRLVVEAA